ncbi:MAG: shikimate dehydrogenase [Deltaproteobacteria bacterium]|nr:shikimate dehydrogenase [Deltaproteobacteria bacterium]
MTGKTKVVGIFGDPVTHSLSPAMHNAAFEALGLDYVYVPFHVKLDNNADLKKAVEGIRAMNIRGVNVTIPHKEKVIKLLDDMHDSAKDIGAVNTIVNDNGRLIGYNTDGDGYISGLKEDLKAHGIKDFSLRNKKAVIIGAGGSARAILVCLIFEVESVIIANRDVKRARKLINALAEKKAMHEMRRTLWEIISENADAVSLKDISSHLQDADILINTTPVGMMGIGSLDIDLGKLPDRAVVSDIVYTPLETDLLSRARLRGLKTVSGLGMLVHQGAAAFKLWTGVKPDVKIMRDAALEALGEKKGQ